MTPHLEVRRYASTWMGTLSQFELTTDDGTLTGYMVELPWRENRTNESCIPPGRYRATVYNAPSYDGLTLWVREVPGRTAILVHVGNSMADLDGCLAPGDEEGFWEERGELAVWNSADTMKAIIDLVRDAGEVDVNIQYWRPEYP